MGEEEPALNLLDVARACVQNRKGHKRGCKTHQDLPFLYDRYTLEPLLLLLACFGRQEIQLGEEKLRGTDQEFNVYDPRSFVGGHA